MQLSLWTFLPPIAVLLVLCTLVVMARRLPGRLAPKPRTASDPSACCTPQRDPGTSLESSAFIEDWLPMLLGIAILAGSIWLLAWLGWVTNGSFHGASALQGAPPWFGTPRLFFLFLCIGVLTAFIGGWVLLWTLAVALAVGTWVVDPDAFYGETPEARILGQRRQQ